MLLQRRKYTYYLRVRVPLDLVGLIGKKEFKQSLRTEDKREAKTIARIKAGEIERAFGRLRVGRETMSDIQIKRLADKLLSEILNKTERARQCGNEVWELSPEEWPEGYLGQVPHGLNVLEASLSRQRTEGGLNLAVQAIESRIKELRNEIRLGNFSEQTRQIAKRRAEMEGMPVPAQSWFLHPEHEQDCIPADDEGVPLDTIPEDQSKKVRRRVKKLPEPLQSTWNERPSPEFGAICRTVAQTLLEAYEIEIERIGGGYGTERQIRADARLMKAAKSYTLNELWNSYKDQRTTEGQWTATTLEKYEGFVKAINRTLGEDFDFSTYEDPDQVTGLIKKLKEYKSTRTRRKWSGTSVNDCIVFLSTLHKYARIGRRFGIVYNPFESRQIIATDSKQREAFTPEELKRIWSNLVRLETRREDDKYWIVLLMLYTGARIGEVCQLRLEDVEQVGKHWVIFFRHKPELGQTLKHAIRKSKKSKGPVQRIAPVHPDLKKLGFFEYVESLRKRGEVKLFPDEKRTANRSGVLMAKKIKTFINGCVGKEAGKSSHCFRHTLITWFNQNCDMSGTQERVLEAMVGHDSNKAVIGPDITWDGYGGSITLEQMSALIKRLNYGFPILHSKITPTGVSKRVKTIAS